jgi:antibiotic biosynthesis monooxygenase
MEHIRIATYEVEEGTLESLIESVHRGLRRTYEAQPGFLRQSLVRLQGMRFLSVTIWASRHQANEAVVVAEAWGLATGSGAVGFRSTPLGEPWVGWSGPWEADHEDVPAAI